jgi:hypothetical protein
MSDTDANEPSDGPRPPAADSGWSGLPDVDWYTPQPPAPASYVGSTGYGGGYAPGPRFGRAPLVNKPRSNLGMAIAVTLLCCLPFGIVAIVYAAQVDSKWNLGDWHGAERASRSAKNWAMAGVVCGIVLTVVYALIVVAAGPKATTTRY